MQPIPASLRSHLLSVVPPNIALTVAATEKALNGADTKVLSFLLRPHPHLCQGLMRSVSLPLWLSKLQIKHFTSQWPARIGQWKQTRLHTNSDAMMRTFHTEGVLKWTMITALVQLPQYQIWHDKWQPDISTFLCSAGLRLGRKGQAVCPEFWIWPCSQIHIPIAECRRSDFAMIRADDEPMCSLSDEHARAWKEVYSLTESQGCTKGARAAAPSGSSL